MEDRLSPWSSRADPTRRQQEGAQAQAWGAAHTSVCLRRWAVCLASKCLPEVFVDFKGKEWLCSGEAYYTPPSLRDGGLHLPKWETVGSCSPDMVCWEGQCTTVGFPSSPGLYLAMRKHQITQPGGHSRRYLTKALHKAQLWKTRKNQGIVLVAGD